MTAMRPGAAAVLAFALAACAVPNARVGLDGVLVVLQPRPDFSVRRLPDDWVTVGATPDPAPSVAADGIDTYLTVHAGTKTFAMMRRVEARLLATPYLGWRWNMAGGTDAGHAVRLTIGLLDAGTPPQRFSGLRLFGPKVPQFSRTITVTWGGSALMRGHVQAQPATRGKRPVARYTARGGRENQNRWWDETLDLSSIHARAWPGLDMRATRIVFIGISAMPTARPAVARLAGLRVSR